MTAGETRPSDGAYERAGRQAAVALRGYCSVIVVSDDPLAAAHVALGAARAEAVHRRVVVGDLAGEVEPIQSLVTDDDPHGIYDSFVFGTSLEKVIRAVGDDENLNVLPSGTESAATAQIAGDRRWRMIAAEFAATDALLLLVVRADLPGLDKLAAAVDGLLVVGEPSLEAVPKAVLLARVPHPPLAPAPKVRIRVEPAAWWRLHWAAIAAAAVLLVVALLAILRPGGPAGNVIARARDTVIIPDTMSGDSTLRAQRALILPANPGDSAAAAAFAVEILAANTAEGANFELVRHGGVMPAATISVVPIGDTEAIWYKVFAGAFGDSVQAERLLASLRRRRIVPDSAGSVVRVPFALRVDDVPAQAAAASKSSDKVHGYAARGLAIYALAQTDGSVRLYAGAFENPQQSSLAATALRVAGLTPVLEYRTGRVQ
ncbi:MAG TPA: hypothetical protein VII02_14210 [Gemmatimonadaceae bacterium]